MTTDRTFTPPPGLGPFVFESPYHTQGIRLTNPTNAPHGCQPRQYSYWSAVNFHAGRPHLWVFLGRLGQTPIILQVEKATGAVSTLEELPWISTGEGCYWSDTDFNKLYWLDTNRLSFYRPTGEVRDGTFQPGKDYSGSDEVFALDARYGNDLWQAHSSADDTVHSATVRRVVSEGSYPKLGCVVYRAGKQIIFQASGDLDECQIDKSGRWLIIQENHTNRIIDLLKGGERTITNEQGALSHIDVGHGFYVGENDQGSMWTMDKVDLVGGARTMLVRGEGEWENGLGHVAVSGNAVLWSSNQTGELIRVEHEHSGNRNTAVPVAPGMIDGHDYDHQLRASLDPSAEFACWIAFVGGRFDAFLVKLPGGSPLIVVTPPDPKPDPKPGGTMAGYPGDALGSVIGRTLFADYKEANQAPNEGMGVWFLRTAWDVANPPYLSVEASIAKHRREWRAILKLPLTPGGAANP